MLNRFGLDATLFEENGWMNHLLRGVMVIVGFVQGAIVAPA